MTLYEVSAEAQDDLFGIWSHIAEDSVELANRIDSIRKDLTKRPVRFIPLYSYLVIYQPDVKPTRIMAVLRGKRNVKRILRERP